MRYTLRCLHSRYLPPAREFYVAFDSSTDVSQDVLDMAFRLHFGGV